MIIRSRGFTLVELVVAVSVAAILLTLAAPSMSQIIASNRLAASANEILGAINYARSEAVKRGTSISICQGPEGWAAYTVADAEGNTLRVGSGSRLSVSSTAECAVFGSVGGLQTAALDISICDAASHQGRTISINVIGRSRAISGSC